MVLAEERLRTEEDYYALPEDVRAELIDGQLLYAQAAPSRIHQTILGELFASISNYIKAKGGSCHVYPAPFAVRLWEDTIVEPDISVVRDPSKLTDHGCDGAPDWIIEIISPGNPNHDYVRKLGLYETAGVREYWIVDPTKDRILVYNLEEGNFKVEIYTFGDQVPSNLYESLAIDFAKLDLS